MLSSMTNALMCEYEGFDTAQDMWIVLKDKFGGTSTTKLRRLTIKFDTYRKRQNHDMRQHLREMSNMIRELKSAGHTLIDEQQIQAVIRSLPNSWENMKINMTHNIKTFDDISRHVELEDERLEAAKASGQLYMAESSKRKTKGFKHNGKKGNFQKGNSQKGKWKGPIENFKKNSGATDHVARDRAAFVEYHRISQGTRWIYVENNSRVEVKGIGTCKLMMHSGQVLYLHDVLYAPGIRRNLVSVIVLLGLGYELNFYGVCMDIVLNSVCVGFVSKYQSNPGRKHWIAVKRILVYLKGIANYSLCYQCGDLRLIGYIDADWGGDLDERKSTSRYAFLLSKYAISWSSKKQTCIALSTIEAEFVAYSAAVQEAVWLKKFLEDLDVSKGMGKPVTVYCDSQAAIAYTKRLQVT
ncbi:hypothetical protein EZV62_015162 [Acer yangbiense]|uniref:Retrovirus-related Pol polyprotein from transposon TNT 1-94-like beta-barrel domain-containing protein n=1 Tax=Acer yangbiense TaxID=1000413 RepID=A0A5C7HUX5_9ROSI|nr:hypothetical protein EZV62_015162 [Acer yangbiense]